MSLSLPFPFLPSLPPVRMRYPSPLAHQFCTLGCDRSQLPPYERPCLYFYSFSFFLSIGFFLSASKHACVSFVFKTPKSKWFKSLLPSNCCTLYPFMVKFLRSCLFSDPTSASPTFTSHRKQFLDPIILNCCPVSFANIVSPFLESHSLPLQGLGPGPSSSEKKIWHPPPPTFGSCFLPILIWVIQCPTAIAHARFRVDKLNEHH